MKKRGCCYEPCRHSKSIFVGRGGDAGAQLLSIRASDGTECLWQGDPAYRSDRAPNLFPYVARLTEGKYYLDGQL